MPEKEFTLEQLRRDLQDLFRLPQIQLVVLFGSRAEGSFRSSSDLDLAVLADQPLDLVDLTNFVTQLLDFSAVDLVDLARCSPILAMVVARRGKVLYETTTGSFAAFCSLALRRYEDTRKLRHAQKEAVRNFLAQRGLHVAN